MTPLIVIDADVLGRERTGDETYVRALLRELADAPEEIFAVTRRPDLVPSGIEAVAVATTGVPEAIASSTGRPKPSYRDGKTRHAAPRYSSASCSWDTCPASSTRCSRPSLEIASRTCTPSRFSGPTRTSRRSPSTSASASRAATGSFRGWMAPTKSA